MKHLSFILAVAAVAILSGCDSSHETSEPSTQTQLDALHKQIREDMENDIHKCPVLQKDINGKDSYDAVCVTKLNEFYNKRMNDGIKAITNR